MGAGLSTPFGIMPVSLGLHLREDLTPGQKETPVRRQGVSVGHPRHEVYCLGKGVGIAGHPLLWTLQVVPEEVRDDAGRFLVLPRTQLVVVHVPEKPRPELHEGLVYRVRKGDLTFDLRVRDHIPHQGVDPGAHFFSENGDRVRREVIAGDDPRPQRVVDVVVDVRDPVGDAYDLTFSGTWIARSCVVEYPVSDLEGEVQTVALILEMVDDAQGVFIVAEGASVGR